MRRHRNFRSLSNSDRNLGGESRGTGRDAMPVSIGIVFASMDRETQEILSYLITYQNTLQSSFEFRLVSCPTDDPFLNLLRQRPGPAHHDVVSEVNDFVVRLNALSADEANSYYLPTEQIDKIVILTNTRFSDNYYHVECPTWAIIALGGWQSEFAPPSIVEYYLSILVTSALDVLGAGVERHYFTRGCNFDFNASLGDKRPSVLSGDICPQCAAKIEAEAGEKFVSDALILLKRDWLGDSNTPSAVATAVKKFGFDLFRTTAAKPNLKERLLVAFEQKGLKNILNVTFQVLLAVAIVVIGLKK
jgi:hypothetical protein